MSDGGGWQARAGGSEFDRWWGFYHGWNAGCWLLVAGCWLLITTTLISLQTYAKAERGSFDHVTAAGALRSNFISQVHLL